MAHTHLTLVVDNALPTRRVDLLRKTLRDPSSVDLNLVYAAIHRTVFGTGPTKELDIAAQNLSDAGEPLSEWEWDSLTVFCEHQDWSLLESGITAWLIAGRTPVDWEPIQRELDEAQRDWDQRRMTG